ncbi:MAG: hypothetical protein ACLGI8_01970 [Acidimicrobiia bacterium]
MTALTLTSGRVGSPRTRRLRALTAVEARRTLRSPWLWCGAAGSAAMTLTAGSVDYQSETYVNATMAVTALALGGFVHAVQVGGRDHSTSLDPFAPAAVMDADERATARLLGLWPLLLVGVLAAVVLGVGERIEGGFWLGEGARRTDSRVHSAFELSQLPAVVLVAAMAGMAAGRAARRRGLVAVLGAVAAAALGFVWWAWQWVPARYVTLMQAQPLEIDLEQGLTASDTPADWWVAAPNEFDLSWRRVLVHEAMAGWHSAYLVGVSIILAGLAVRGRIGVRLVAVGLGIAVAGVAAQMLVAPGSPVA